MSIVSSYNDLTGKVHTTRDQTVLWVWKLPQQSWLSLYEKNCWFGSILLGFDNVCCISKQINYNWTVFQL